jgi:hypothetical protein
MCVVYDMMVSGVTAMPISDAKRKANQKWNRANMARKYYRPSVLLPREMQAAIAARVRATKSASVSDYIRRLIDNDLGAGD